MNRRPSPVPIALFAVAGLFCTAAAVEALRSQRNTSNQTTAGNTPAKTGADDQAVMSRTFVVGTTSRVRELLKENPQGYQFRGTPHDVRVDERPSPARCGLPLAGYFRDQIVSTFKISTTNDCRIAADSVDCRSNLLPGYSRTYLSLAYNWRQTEVDLALQIRQRGLWGDVRDPQLAGSHVEWMERVFDCLVSMAECPSVMPPCSLKR